MSFTEMDGGPTAQGKHHANWNRALEKPAAASEDSRSGGGSVVVALLERTGSVALPIAIALYALLHLGIQSVYSEFNVTPEQVGVDQAIMFGRLVGTIVLLILLGALLFGPMIAIAWLINKITLGHAGRAVHAVRRHPWLAAALGAVWCGATYWGFLGYLDLDEGVDALFIVLVATAIGVLAFLVPFRLLRSRPVGRAGMTIMVGAFTGIGLGFALMGAMEGSATRLAETGQQSYLLSFLGFQDQWVVAAQRESGRELRDGTPLMLLGEANGAYAFYDCAKQETFRISMEATTIQRIQLDPERDEGFDCRNPQAG